MPEVVVKNHFRVMPTDTNYMSPLIFGGAFMSQLDLCAATAVKQALHYGVCKHAVTHKADFEFQKPTYLGDTIYMTATIAEVGKKSLVVEVVAEREKPSSSERDKVASARFVFVCVEHADFGDKPDMLPYARHHIDPHHLRYHQV